MRHRSTFEFQHALLAPPRWPPALALEGLWSGRGCLRWLLQLLVLTLVVGWQTRSLAVARAVEPRWLSRESAYFLRAVYNSRIAPFKTDSADLCRHSWDPRLGDPRAGRAQRLGSRDGGVVFAKRVSGFLPDGREGARSQVRNVELGKSHTFAPRTLTSHETSEKPAPVRSARKTS